MRDAEIQLTQPDAAVLRWRGLDRRTELRVWSVLKAWEGTPYMAGQRAPGIGVDCVQLVAAVMDQLHQRMPPSDVPRLPADAAMHSVRAGFRTIRTLRKLFPSDIARDGAIEPGDIVVTRAAARGGPRRPGHVMIASTTPGVALHAIPNGGACFGSLQATRGIVRLYRPREKRTWAL